MINMKKYEKSVGAIVYYKTEDQKYFFLVQQHINDNHWAFAKGHVEENETETETASREILEETGIKEIALDTHFRETTVYSPKKDIEKEVVYFIAETTKRAADSAINQAIEIQEIEFLSGAEALRRLTFPNDQLILKKAITYLSH